MRKFYTLFMLVILFAFNTVSGQLPANVKWAKLYSSPASESFQKIIPLANGYLLVGDRDVSHSGEDISVIPDPDIRDIWIAKVDAAGNTEWEKTYGGSGMEKVYAGIVTNDNGYLIVGTTASILNDGEVTGHHGNATGLEGDENDVWVLKLDAGGNLMWAKTYGGGRDDQGNAVVQNSAGNYVIAGYTKSWDGDLLGIRKSNDLPNPLPDQDTDRDTWVCTIDGAGNLIGKHCYGGSGLDFAESIVLNGTTGYWVVGSTSSSDADLGGVTVHGDGDAWLFQIDHSGTIGFNKTYGGSDFDFFSRLIMYNGKIYVGGETSSDDGDVVGYHSPGPEWEWMDYMDVWLVEISPAGQILQQNCIGTTSLDFLIDMLVVPGVGILQIESRDEGYALVTYDWQLGQVNKTRLTVEMRSLATAADGGLYLAGSTYPVTFDPGPPPFPTETTEGLLMYKAREAQVVPAGTHPVTGTIASAVTYDPSVQTYEGHPYVQLHYDITPINDPATATATITLYFSQQEFDNYNAHPAHGLDLPHHGTDDFNKANLRVYQYHGFSTTSLPGSYSGNGVEIDPEDTKIWWNATTAQWEVTFDVNGFSGFFISSAGNSLLPVTFLSFAGQARDQSVKLQWTTTSELNVARFEVQRRDNTSGYVTIGKVAPAGTDGLTKDYSYTDELGSAPVYYYRLKVVDLDESATYSKAIMVKPASGKSLITLGPNPASSYVVVKHPVSRRAQVRITDLSGRVLKTVAVANYSLQTRINLNGLAKGTYSLVWEDGDISQSLVLVVQ